MLSARASGSKQTFGYQDFTKINTVRLAPTPRIRRKHLVTTGAICESNGLFFFRVETTRKDTELLKCE